MHDNLWHGLLLWNMHQGKIAIQGKWVLGGGLWGPWLQAREAGALSRWKSVVLLITEETLVTFFQGSVNSFPLAA